jgi:AcrR family transcriptional regulator
MSAARNLATEPTAPVLRWVHAPQQARTREGLARLFEAAEELIAEKGYDEAGIVEIAQRAGSSVGGFYRRFRDKDGIIQALHERFCGDAKATADDALAPARWAGAPLSTVLREFIAFLAQIHRERGGLLRAFRQRAMSDASLRQRTADLFGHLADRLSALLDSRRHEMTHPEPDLAAAFGLEMVLGTLNHLLDMQPHPLSLDDDRLVVELTRAFACYLGVRADKPELRISKRRPTA